MDLQRAASRKGTTGEGGSNREQLKGEVRGEQTDDPSNELRGANAECKVPESEEGPLRGERGKGDLNAAELGALRPIFPVAVKDAEEHLI